MSRARITAPSGSTRYSPSSPAGTSSESAPAVSSCAPSAPMTSAARPTPGRASTPNQTASSTTSPPSETLRLGPGGEEAAVDPGAELHARREPAAEPEREVEGWGPVLWAQVSRATETVARARGAGARNGSRSIRAPRRVEPDPVDAAEIGVLGVADAHGRVLERREVVGGDRRRHRIPLDGLDRDPETRERERVAADPAAEVGDAFEAGVPEARRVSRCDGEAGRLLEAVVGVEQPPGELAELRDGLRPEARLSEHLAHELRRVTRLPQRGHGVRDVARGRDRPDLVEEPERVGAQQDVEVHHAAGLIRGGSRTRAEPVAQLDELGELGVVEPVAEAPCDRLRVDGGDAAEELEPGLGERDDDPAAVPPGPGCFVTSPRSVSRSIIRETLGWLSRRRGMRSRGRADRSGSLDRLNRASYSTIVRYSVGNSALMSRRTETCARKTASHASTTRRFAGMAISLGASHSSECTARRSAPIPRLA